MKYKIILALLIISLISSLILTLTPTPIICEKGCDIVQTSKYAYTFGVKNSVLGVFAFAILSAITILQIKQPSKNRRITINLSVAIGAIVAIYFIYLQHFILFSYCKYCLVVDMSMIISIGIILFYKK